MRDGEEEEEEEESGSKAEFIWLTESNPFPVLNREFYRYLLAFSSLYYCARCTSLRAPCLYGSFKKTVRSVGPSVRLLEIGYLFVVVITKFNVCSIGLARNTRHKAPSERGGREKRNDICGKSDLA